MDGIGATLQWRKQSFIVTHLTHGKWIGSLKNEHHTEEGDQSYYFGLSYPDCDEKSLKAYKHIMPGMFTNVPKENMLNYIRTTKVNKTTVLVFKWGYMEEEYNYMVFDEAFRKRFHRQRALRLTPKRDDDDYWVSLHFRWGDTMNETNDLIIPNGRNGLRLIDYCKCIAEILSIKPSAKVFVFAEKLENFYETCHELDRNKVLHLGDSRSWRRDIDIMSQSNLLIGGSSSFFMLGAHLCQNCTVIHNSVAKFKKTHYERKLTSHMNAQYCDKNLECYLKQIRKYL